MRFLFLCRVPNLYNYTKTNVFDIVIFFFSSNVFNKSLYIYHTVPIWRKDISEQESDRVFDVFFFYSPPPCNYFTHHHFYFFFSYKQKCNNTSNSADNCKDIKHHTKLLNAKSRSFAMAFPTTFGIWNFTNLGETSHLVVECRIRHEGAWAGSSLPRYSFSQ